MHEKETYERIITAQLQTLSAPGLEDSIWQRIERQLDIELPEDGGEEGPAGPQGPAGGFLPGLSLFFGALLLSYFYLLQPPSAHSFPAAQTPLPDNSSQAPAAVSPTTASSGGPPGGAATGAARQPLTPSHAAQLSAAPVPSIVDTATTRMPVPVDTVMLLPPATATAKIPAAQPRSDTPTAKRPRGTQGITDSSYKIVPAKGRD